MFKIGDKVKCVNVDPTIVFKVVPNLTIGKIYTVLDFENGGYLKVTNDRDVESFYAKERFVLASFMSEEDLM